MRTETVHCDVCKNLIQRIPFPPYIAVEIRTSQSVDRFTLQELCKSCFDRLLGETHKAIADCGYEKVKKQA